MIKEQRISQVKQFIYSRQSVSLDELVSVFQVSKNTIRRDVQELVESGEFTKIYGGVKAKEPKILESFQTRKVRSQPAKTAIGLAAARFVEDGDIIFIDSGTTTLEMFEGIFEKEITIVTNNLEFITRALPFDHLTVIVIGGMLERKTNALGSPQNVELLKTYNVTKAFMASTGVSISNGVTNSSSLETELKRTAVERSQQSFLLIDHLKINRYGLTTYCKLSDIDCIITDTDLPMEYAQYAEQHRIQTIKGE
ncbi:DeoR/GlpR family DNA-binding transcription regulator [Domibacillus sp. A3M-37]|uniref:DeoR/GlpR family DNA-binding transcription regulator n=1 Tax=Domibacillus sp. A3M-37 TaxID=2962037 RepID=UPI0020B8143B|nr:DeoR/GlpR family DNA-binding transcription regulator [Domibacillus sp. A3M-37]MCP3763651.1 DeoR/GlpR family DNA-binding transcription regulator [Domibacillus sp. A3M-37]